MDRTESDAIARLARDVAQYLGGVWEVKPFPADWGRRGANIVDPNRQIMLSLGDSQEYSDRGKMRLTVSTDYPKDRHGHMSSAKRPKISVSALKTGEQIARDIERRLLPIYLPILDKELTTNQPWNEYEGKTTLVATHIANIVRVKQKSKDTTVSFYHSPYKILRNTMSEAKVVGENDVELTLRLDAETTLKTLNLLIHGRFEIFEENLVPPTDD